MQPAPDNAQLGQQVLKLGTHRNNRRIWLDNSPMLTAAGFFPGLKYRADFVGGGDLMPQYRAINGAIFLTVDPEGKTKVSKKTKGGKLLPVIDINSKKVGLTFPAAENISVTYYSGQIMIGAAQ
jgi:DNA (cytosine-5)-methyltransferase 1